MLERRRGARARGDETPPSALPRKNFAQNPPNRTSRAFAGIEPLLFTSRVFSSSGASGRLSRGTRTRTAPERRLAVDSSPREARWTRAHRSRRPRRRFGTEGSADTAPRRSESSSRGALLVRLTLGDDVERVRGGRRRGRGLARASGCPRAPGPTGRGPAPAHPRARASRVPDARSPESRPSRVASRVPGAGLRGRAPAPRLRPRRGDARRARGGAERASRGRREGWPGRRRRAR
jgi:hypothetical protein